MVSVLTVVLPRREVGIALEALVKGGDILVDGKVRHIEGDYTKGSWVHIKQSDKVLLKAWKPIKRKPSE